MFSDDSILNFFIAVVLSWIIIVIGHIINLPNLLKNLTMVNTKVLLKAMGYMFMPTVSVMAILFFVTLDWDVFISLILGKDVTAYFIRIILLIAEVVCVVYMYKYFIKKEPEKLKNGKILQMFDKNILTQKLHSYSGQSDPRISTFLDCWNSDNCTAYKTTDPSIRIVILESKK